MAAQRSKPSSGATLARGQHDASLRLYVDSYAIAAEMSGHDTRAKRCQTVQKRIAIDAPWRVSRFVRRPVRRPPAYFADHRCRRSNDAESARCSYTRCQCWPSTVASGPYAVRNSVDTSTTCRSPPECSRHCLRALVASLLSETRCKPSVMSYVEC